MIEFEKKKSVTDIYTHTKVYACVYVRMTVAMVQRLEHQTPMVLVQSPIAAVANCLHSDADITERKRHIGLRGQTRGRD